MDPKNLDHELKVDSSYSHKLSELPKPDSGYKPLKLAYSPNLAIIYSRIN